VEKQTEEVVSQAELYEQIGWLNVELDWLKKKLPRGASELRRWIDPDELRISIARQCELLGLPRSTYYYSPAAATDEDLLLMRRIDEQ
jgi:putative transposase